MVTTVTGTRPDSVRTKKGVGFGPVPPTGNGSRKNGGGGGGSRGGDSGGEDARSVWPERYRLGVFVGIASILMMFTALASAFVVRSGLPTSTDWRPVEMPAALLVSTALIILSSVSMTLAQKSAGHAQRHKSWLTVTLMLGIGFLAAQFWAWRQLVGQGVYLSSNPHSSFLYVLTGLHGLHLLGGIFALSLLRIRASLRADVKIGDKKGRALADAVGIYWHFMDGLWVFLFVLLFYWR